MGLCGQFLLFREGLRGVSPLALEHYIIVVQVLELRQLGPLLPLNGLLGDRFGLFGLFSRRVTYHLKTRTRL